MVEKIATKQGTSHVIDPGLCTRCDLCVIICPAGILARNEHKEVYFKPEKVDVCIRCGHCMAMCETAAIAIEGLSYEDNFRPLPPVNWNHAAFMDFLLTRRSVRVFRDKPVPMEELQKIVDALATAPFGVHPDNVEITVVNDRSLIVKAFPYMAKVYLQLGKILRVPVIGWSLLKIMPKETANTLVNFIAPHIKKGLYDGSSGIDDITRNAPAMILFHAPKGAEEHTVDAHIYLTYALLAAHSLGLGATAIGLIGPAVNQSKPLRKMFRIPAENEVVESMIVGYPRFPFKKAIVRPRTKVTFIS
ncbi:MAG: nitroreductase family protein [Bacteroidetes bacterium]|nr:nitroreductase family protein [Bacteroidota bacterium]